MTSYTVDESVILAALEKDPKIFKSLENPSHEIVDFMVRNHTKFLIECCKMFYKEWKDSIDNCPPTLVRTLAKKQRLAMKFEDLKFTINQNPYNIELITYWECAEEVKEKYSEQLRMMAVTKNGLAIKFIDNPSNEVQLAAVTNNPDALLSITNPYINAVKKALELKPELFKKMEDITEKTNQKAVTIDVNSLSNYEASELMERLKVRLSRCSTVEGSNYLTDSMKSAVEEVDKWPDWQKKAMGIKPKEDDMSLERIKSELSNIEQQFFNHPCTTTNWTASLNHIEIENLLKEFHTLNTERNRWLNILEREINKHVARDLTDTDLQTTKGQEIYNNYLELINLKNNLK